VGGWIATEDLNLEFHAERLSSMCTSLFGATADAATGQSLLNQQ
jgi:hypothetical protein